MANTYTQLYIHAVFAVKHRHGLIKPAWREDLYRYITGIVQNSGHKMLAINGMADHIHVFVGLNPVQSIASLLQAVKGDSSKWINENRLVPGRFEWQSGYGAFSYGQSQIDVVVQYILNQEEHHRKRTFLEEYTGFLRQFNVDFNEQYLFTNPLE